MIYQVLNIQKRNIVWLLEFPTYNTMYSKSEVGLNGLRFTLDVAPSHEWNDLWMPVRNAINQLNPPPRNQSYSLKYN